MKEFWFMGSPATTHQQSLVSLFLRLFIGIAMLTHGLAKVENFEALSTQFLDPIGIGPQASLALATFAEVGCSVLLLVGLFTRLAGITLAFNMMVASMLVGGEKGFSAHELAALYLAIYVGITVIGGGHYSLDALLFRHAEPATEKTCTNVGPLDRMIRLLLGLLCWFLLFFETVTGPWAIALFILSIPLFLSSFWGYCGLYSLLGKKKRCNPSDQ